MEKNKNMDRYKNGITYTMAYHDTMNDICNELDYTYYAVYLRLLSHRNEKTGDCFPSFSTLAKELNCSVINVKRKINDLEEKGYIKHNSGKLGKLGEKNISNYYYFIKYDINENVDEVKESLATKKKKTYKKKDKFNTNKDEEIVNNIVKEVEYNLKDDEDYEYKSNEYDIKIIKAVNKKLDELKKEIFDS